MKRSSKLSAISFRRRPGPCNMKSTSSDGLINKIALRFRGPFNGHETLPGTRIIKKHLCVCIIVLVILSALDLVSLQPNTPQQRSICSNEYFRNLTEDLLIEDQCIHNLL